MRQEEEEEEEEKGGDGKTRQNLKHVIFQLFLLLSKLGSVSRRKGEFLLLLLLLFQGHFLPDSTRLPIYQESVTGRGGGKRRSIKRGLEYPPLLSSFTWLRPLVVLSSSGWEGKKEEMCFLPSLSLSLTRQAAAHLGEGLEGGGEVLISVLKREVGIKFPSRYLGTFFFSFFSRRPL